MAVMASMTPAVKYKPALNKRQTEAAKFNQRNARDSKGRTKSKAYRQDVRRKPGNYEQDASWRGYLTKFDVFTSGSTVGDELKALRERLAAKRKELVRGRKDLKNPRTNSWYRERLQGQVGEQLEEVNALKQAIADLERNKKNIQRLKDNPRPQSIQSIMQDANRDAANERTRRNARTAADERAPQYRIKSDEEWQNQIAKETNKIARKKSRKKAKNNQAPKDGPLPKQQEEARRFNQPNEQNAKKEQYKRQRNQQKNKKETRGIRGVSPRVAEADSVVDLESKIKETIDGVKSDIQEIWKKHRKDGVPAFKNGQLNDEAFHNYLFQGATQVFDKNTQQWITKQPETWAARLRENMETLNALQQDLDRLQRNAGNVNRHQAAAQKAKRQGRRV